MQVVLVVSSCISAIHSWNVSQPEIIQKFTKSPILGVQGHSKLIVNVDIPKKLIASAYYDKQHAYLQPFSR